MGVPRRGTPGYVLPTLLERPITSEDSDTWGALLVLFNLLSDIPASELLWDQFETLSETGRALAKEHCRPRAAGTRRSPCRRGPLGCSP